MSPDLETYTHELLLALRWRDVPGARIGEALAEVGSHVAETGEDPRAAFGAPGEYADEVAEALGQPGGRSGLWREVASWSTLGYGLAGALGAWLLQDGVLARVAGERAVLGLAPVVSIVLGLATLIGLAAALARLARVSEDPVLDPRTGDVTPTGLPRWVPVLLLTPPVLAVVLAVVLGLLAR